MPVFAKLAQKWLFFIVKNVNWRLLACDLADFGNFKLTTLLRKKIITKESEKNVEAEVFFFLRPKSGPRVIGSD